MSREVSRRRLLKHAAALPLLGIGGAVSRGRPVAAQEQRYGPPTPFTFDALRAEAKARAQAPYQAPAVRHHDILQTIDYDVFQQIRFLPEHALWADGSTAFPVQFFHLGKWFEEPVAIHALTDGTAREVIYRKDMFDFGSTGLDRLLPGDLGFAGFRLMHGEDRERDWLVFLGASYFRSAGPLDQYGMSARGIAIDTALPTPEEFPRFTAFWLEQAPAGDGSMTMYALLEGPSLTGAYRFDVTRASPVVTEIRAHLFPRAAITRLGVAPLTSMFWFGENNRHQATDWRPEIHDSDGLALWTGAGERIWRPLNNPHIVQTNVVADDNPRGFGLLQRDRSFENYEDDGVFYDRRPSVWVEPLGDWGRGAVHLVEIPTDDEIHDNIAAYWVPEAPVVPGTELTFAYRLHWAAEEPVPPESVGRVVATRLGRGGVPGQPRPANRKKFVIDFAGGPLAGLEQRYDVETVVTASRGVVSNDYALRIVGSDRWRAFFDLEVDGAEPVDLRCYLRLNGRTLTETWLYQYFPFRFDAL